MFKVRVWGKVREGSFGPTQGLDSCRYYEGLDTTSTLPSPRGEQWESKSGGRVLRVQNTEREWKRAVKRRMGVHEQRHLENFQEEEAQTSRASEVGGA